DQVTVFDAGVPDQLLVGSRAAVNVIADEHEVDCGLPYRGQLLPRDPGVKNELPPPRRRDYGCVHIRGGIAVCPGSAIEASEIWPGHWRSGSPGCHGRAR